MTALLRLRLVFQVILLTGTCCNAEQAPRPDRLDKLRGLPEVALDRRSEFDVQFESWMGHDAGMYHHGFAFITPSLVDGPATWLVVWGHEEPDASPWELTTADGKVLVVASPVPEALGNHPALIAKFPGGRSIQRLRVDNNRLVKATRYQAVVTTRGGDPPLGISMNVAARGVGQWPVERLREMEIPEGKLSSLEVMELVENIRAFRGDAAAIAFLDSQFAANARDREEHNALFGKVWNEAQFGTGIDDPEWASRLYDAGFTSVLATGNYARVFQIMNNLFGALASSARYGRFSEVHAVLEEGYRRGGQNMDPSTYPDRGPAISSLPVIRRRDITMATPYSLGFPRGPRPISIVPSFDADQARALLSYASHRMHSGDWQAAIEWTVWIREWAADDDGIPLQPRNEIWYSATFSIANYLMILGYIDDALAIIEEAVAAPYGGNYRGRARINTEHNHLKLLRRVHGTNPEIIEKFHELINRMEDHLHFGRANIWFVKNDLAMALFDAGRHEEGDLLIEEIIGEGFHYARWTRLDRWLETGAVEGVEEELIALLTHNREGGHKTSELGLYGRYAGFLESRGRLREALAMRQEAVRLARDFNAFTQLPVHLANLAALLHKLGYADLAGRTADEARSLIDSGHMPARTIERVATALESTKVTAGTPTMDAGMPQPEIELQPHRALVIPIEGAPWMGYLALVNPGTVAIRGILDISGIPHLAKESGESGDIQVGLVEATDAGGHSSLNLVLDPGAYRLITVEADAAHAGEGEMEFTWLSADASEAARASMWIDAREQGVAGAMIQAGDYQTNPFYGVAIHLGYVSRDQAAKSPPIRFRASQAARLEIHHVDGTPLAVDGTGNGSLLDRGDEVFGETDGVGHLQIALSHGAAGLRIIAYPADSIAPEGLTIDVEVWSDGEWLLHSRNKIEP